MSTKKRAIKKIPDIKTRLLLAIWKLTEEDPEKYVTRIEIVDFMTSYFGPEAEVTEDYVRKQIKKINAKWDTFAEDPDNHHLWRLHENTIKRLDTAFVIYNLLHNSTPSVDDRSIRTALRNTKQLARKALGLTGPQVTDRVKAAMKCDYIEIKKSTHPHVERCYTSKARYRSERIFVSELARMATGPGQPHLTEKRN